MALAGTAAAVALIAGSAVCRADPLEPSLIGAWATSAPDCAKLFVGQRGGLAYRQPVDKFAQALIIGPQQNSLPFQHLPRSKRVSREGRDQSERRVRGLDQLPAAISLDQNAAERWRSSIVRPAIRRSTRT